MRVMLQTRSWKGKEGGAGMGTPYSVSSSGWPADGESPVGSSLFGVWPTAEEWMGSLRSRAAWGAGQLTGKVSAFCPRLHGVDAIREFLHEGMPQMGTKAHQGVSEKLNPRCSSKTVLPSSSCILRPGRSITTNDLLSCAGARASSLENWDLVGRKFWLCWRFVRLFCSWSILLDHISCQWLSPFCVSN